MTFHYIIAAIYRPPKASFTNSMQDLRKIFEVLNSSNKRFIVAGDFNIDTLVGNSNSVTYNDLLDEFQLKQLVKEPTRVTSKTSTCLDHIVSNIDFIKARSTHFSIFDEETQCKQLIAMDRRKIIYYSKSLTKQFRKIGQI